MKLLLINLFLTVAFLGCDFMKQDKISADRNAIIYKFKPRKNNGEVDTLWVSQIDTTVFKREEMIQRRTGRLVTAYELIEPKIDTYYFIYNEKKQLLSEGKYTKEYTYDGAPSKSGNFYNTKTYDYKNNGKLNTIHYTKDGRNFKVESYDRQRRLTEITYRELKSGDVEKVEFYRDGKLRKTRIYTSFENYYTVDADD